MNYECLKFRFSVPAKPHIQCGGGIGILGGSNHVRVAIGQTVLCWCQTIDGPDPDQWVWYKDLLPIFQYHSQISLTASVSSGWYSCTASRNGLESEMSDSVLVDFGKSDTNSLLAKRFFQIQNVF